jgi:hypothetical protein
MADRAEKEQLEVPAHRHEERDANVKIIFILAVAMVVTIVLVGVGSGIYYYYLSKNWPHSGTATAPVIDQSQVPPPPQLQTSPQQDLKKMREYEDARLRTYGWIDRQAGVAHIPIDRAIDLTAQRGLPWRETRGLAKGVAPPAPEIGVMITGPGVAVKR